MVVVPAVADGNGDVVDGHRVTWDKDCVKLWWHAAAGSVMEASIVGDNQALKPVAMPNGHIGGVHEHAGSDSPPWARRQRRWTVKSLVRSSRLDDEDPLKSL